jgi:dephospho-CoA kinase
MPKLIVLTGASGSGKTTLANAVASKHGARIEVLFFDSIGVPPAEETISKFGSGEAWQRAKTLEWMKRISAIKSESSVLFEGQMRISFIHEALASASIHSAHIILVDCDDKTRMHRLVMDRTQDELASSRMMNWARFLRNEALRRGHEILDTTRLDVDACVERICRHI